MRCGRQSPDPTLRVEPGVAEPVSGGTAAEVTAASARAIGPNRLE